YNSSYPSSCRAACQVALACGSHKNPGLLKRSFSGKALAVRRVTENQGKRTPGVDGRTWNDPRQKAQAIHSLKQRGYQPKPLKRVNIPKKNGKTRPLGIPMCPSYCTSFQ